MDVPLDPEIPILIAQTYNAKSIEKMLLRLDGLYDEIDSFPISGFPKRNIINPAILKLVINGSKDNLLEALDLYSDLLILKAFR